MLNSVTFKNYRCFSNLKLENLKPINLIVGANNVGKTAVLEGLAIPFFQSNRSANLAQLFRNSPTHEEQSAFWDWLVKRGSEEEFAQITCSSTIFKIHSNLVRDGSEAHKRVKGQTPKPRDPMAQSSTIQSNLGGGWINWSNLARIDQTKGIDFRVISRPSSLGKPEAISNLYNEIAPLNPDGEDEIQDFLRYSIEPRLKRIRYALAKDTKTHLAYVQLEGIKEMVPFTQLGQAFSSTLHLYCLLYAEEPDAMLVDEIENGIYYQGLNDFWKGLHAAVHDRGTQLFATTHSFECMQAAHFEAKKLNREYPINFIRLDRHPKSGEIIATEFGEEEMESAIQNHWDMR